MTATKPLPPFGSQQAIDALVLDYHLLVVPHLLADPEAVIKHALGNLERWMKVHEGSGAEITLREWQALLTAKTAQELVEIISEDSDEGQRLRSSTPFVGILSDEVVKELRAKHDARYKEYKSD